MAPTLVIGQRVSIAVMTAGAVMRIAESVGAVHDTGGLADVVAAKADTDGHDTGTGIILALANDKRTLDPDSDVQLDDLYHVAVINGSFDAHRNGDGDLLCWGKELMPV